MFVPIFTVLNPLSIAIDDIIQFGSRKRQNFQDYQNFPRKKYQGWDEKIGYVE
jgi:hypothetical protein